MGTSGVEVFDPARLRTARGKAGLTQRDLAEKVLLARPDSPLAADHAGPSDMIRAARTVETVRLQIGDYEVGKVLPRAPMLYELAQALGVDVLDLLRPNVVLDLTLQRVRRGKRLTDVVAAGLGVTAAYLGRVERGEATLNEATRARLAAILDLSEDEIAQSLTAKERR